MQNEIKASELRIGNYLTSKTWKGIHPVSGIELTDNGFKILVKGYYHTFEKGLYTEMEGIPITPEILEKAGFALTGQNNGAFVAYDINEIYRIYLENGKYSLWILDRDYEEVAYCRLTDLSYLHQLQNLYYALTNEELNIEL